MNIHTIHIFPITQKYIKSGKPKVCQYQIHWHNNCWHKLTVLRKRLSLNITSQWRMILTNTKTSIARRVSAVWAIISDKLMYPNSGLLREAAKRSPLAPLFYTYLNIPTFYYCYFSLSIIYININLPNFFLSNYYGMCLAIWGGVLECNL